MAKNKRPALSIATAALLAAVGASAAAQAPGPGVPASPGPAIPPNPDPKDFQGDWQAPPVDHAVAAGYKDPRVGQRQGAPDNPEGLRDLPLKPDTAAKLQRFIQLTLKGTAPVIWRIACRPAMPQRMFNDDLGGIEIFQTQKEIVFLFDTDNSYWRIYLDRDHPADITPSYYGHSVGHWDGDTLVVDTVGYNGRTSIVTGVGHDEKLHTVTRMWKAEGGRELHYQTSFQDPGNFTAPVTMPESRLRWTPEHRIYEEHCTQSTREENYSDMVFDEFSRDEAFPYLQKKTSPK